MIVPGSNLLAIAGRVIRFQRVTWRAWASRAVNAVGEWESTYLAPVVVRGSWQPVNRDRYEQQGLDLARKYYNFYTSHPLRGVEIGRGADQVDRQGRRYDVVDVQPWDEVDGWSHVLLVDVGAIPPPPEPEPDP